MDIFQGGGYCGHCLIYIFNKNLNKIKIIGGKKNNFFNIFLEIKMGPKIGNNPIKINNINYKILLLIKYKNKGIIIKQKIIFYNKIPSLKKMENIIFIFINIFGFG